MTPVLNLEALGMISHPTENTEVDSRVVTNTLVSYYVPGLRGTPEETEQAWKMTSALEELSGELWAHCDAHHDALSCHRPTATGPCNPALKPG